MLTDEQPGSEGILLLVVKNAEDWLDRFGDLNGSYGPSDHIGRHTVAELVQAWAQRRGRTAEDRAIARRFLQQWPAGPQLEDVCVL